MGSQKSEHDIGEYTMKITIGEEDYTAALDAERWKEVAGTLAGDDTVLIVTPSRSARAAVQKRIEEMLG